MGQGYPANYDAIIYVTFEIKKCSPSGGLEPPTFRLTVERANQLRHEGSDINSVYVTDIDFVLKSIQK